MKDFNDESPLKPVITEAGPSSQNERRRKRKRGRLETSCAECRRLKVKCDQEVPCGGCIKRGCGDLCPQDSVGSLKELLEERRALKDRVKQLEQAHRGAPSLSSSLSPEQTITSAVQPYSVTGNGLSPSRQPPPAHHIPSGYLPHASSSIHQSSYIPNESPMHATPHSAQDLESSGTLVSFADGRSTFLGPSANPQWLSEGYEPSRPPSPTQGRAPRTDDLHKFAPYLFTSTSSLTATEARAQLPLVDEARNLVEINYRHLAWNGTTIPREDFYEIFNAIYWPKGQSTTTRLEFSRLAAVAITLALGTLVNVELPPDDPSSKQYFNLAQQCLASSHILVSPDILSVQTICLMGRWAAYADVKHGWDLAWQLRGLAARLIQAMGIHRDGEKWGLSRKDLDERRRVFWDVFGADVFLSRNADRPSTFIIGQFDTKMPEDFTSGTGFELEKAELSLLAKEALDESLRITPSPYARTVEIWHRIANREAEVPFHLRCRPSLRAMVSRYTSQDIADAMSPEPSRRDLRLTMQQHSLACDYSGAVFLLLRPYFVNALYAFPSDPTLSPYADAYLAVIERSSMFVALLRSLYQLFPMISMKHWMFWTHAFSAAVCMATVCLIAPTSLLVDLALQGLESVISLYTTVLSFLPRKSLHKNLDWLQWLRQRALTTIASARAKPISGTPLAAQSDPNPASSAAAENLALVGWKTRLIDLGPKEVSRTSLKTHVVPQTAEEMGLDLSLPTASLPHENTSGSNIAPNNMPNDNFLWGDGNTEAGSMLLDSEASELLHQLLGAPLSQPLPNLENVQAMFDTEG